jgi:hypothetical protein
MLNIDDTNELEYQYACADSSRLYSLYKVMGELSCSLTRDFLAFGARFSHLLNFFEFTVKLNCGWIVGNPKPAGTKTPISKLL